jgi:WD40 repeat protein
VNSEDVSEAEPKDLAQERTETPTDVPSDSSSDEAVAALKKLGARIKQDDQGNVVELNLSRSKITDAGLVHLKGLPELQKLNIFFCPKITDAGLVHLKGMANLQELNLTGTKFTDAGVAQLQDLQVAVISPPPRPTPGIVVRPQRVARRGWGAQTGQEMLTLKGHSGTVNSVSFSPDGKRIVSGSWDNTLKVWDAQAGQETLTLEGHAGIVSSVSFSSDGKRIVSGGGYRTAVFAGLRGVAKVWDISSLATSK